jgi:hypothetical protein
MSGAWRIDDHAVSPVIGVMLMIVVTIIIAAVVSAFAGGLVGEQKKVPVALFEMKLYSSFQDEAAASGGRSFTVGGTSYPVYGGVPQFMVIMKSGEPLPTKDLKLVTYRTASNGTVLKHEYTGETTWGEGGLYWDLPYHKGTSIETSEDTWGGGNSIIHPGEVYRANSAAPVNKVLGDGVSSLAVGDTIEVNIVHTPTNAIIYHQVVTVQ